jgi:CRP-like cAMP-binding protein
MTNKPVLYLKKAEKAEASSDASTVISILNCFHPLSEGVIKFLKEHAYSCSFNKGELLLEQGQVCEHIYFIKKGVVRGFIREGKREITTWITGEGEMVSSILTFEEKGSAIENMQAIEDCEMLALTLVDLEKLYEQFPEFNIVSRKLLQKYYSDAEGRAFIARLTNAETKYRQFLTRYSHFANRVPLTYIASFLGITLETLSRVRRKISTKKLIS